MRRSFHRVSAIVRHRPSTIPPTPAIVDEALIKQIDAHIRRYIGPVSFAFHEASPRYVHIAVHVVEPRPDRPHFTLVTSGMSAAPMRLPFGRRAELRYAELAMCLWPEWTPACQWPVQWLRDLARLPHQYDSWLDFGHSVPNGDPAEPIGDTPFTGVVILPLLSEPPQARMLCRAGGKEVDIFALWPVKEEEMRYKLVYGAEALMRRLARRGVSDVVMPDR